MDELITYLQRFAPLGETDITIIRNHIRIRTLARDDYFLESETVPSQLGFLLRGVLRVGYYDNRGREVIKCFIPENCFAVDIHTFRKRIPSREFISAATEATMVIFTPDSLGSLSVAIPSWDPMMAAVGNSVLIEKLARQSALCGETACLRYQEFSRRYPGLSEVIAPAYLATYLGVSLPTVSRLRRRRFRK